MLRMLGAVKRHAFMDADGNGLNDTEPYFRESDRDVSFSLCGLEREDAGASKRGGPTISKNPSDSFREIMIVL